jgi:hypothetical protein
MCTRHRGPTRQVRTELRLAAWRASRSGRQDMLIHPLTGMPERAATVVKLLLEHVGDAQAEARDTATVADLLAAVIGRATALLSSGTHTAAPATCLASSAAPPRPPDTGKGWRSCSRTNMQRSRPGCPWPATGIRIA